MSLEFNIDPEEAKAITDEHTPVEEKPVPTHRLIVVAQDDLKEIENEWNLKEDAQDFLAFHESQIVGYIDAPTVFCPGLNCNEGTGKDPLRYYRKAGTNLWVHAGCGLPTEAWWNSMLHDLMEPTEKDGD